MATEKHPKKRNQSAPCKKKRRYTALAVAILTAVAVAISITVTVLTTQKPETVSYNDFCKLVEEGQVEKITFPVGGSKFTFQRNR